MNTEKLVQVFRGVEPGVITVSGGEPTLWEAMPSLLDQLSQHYWVILTNLSRPVSWLRDDRIKLVIAAYHEEFTGPHFAKYLKELGGKSIVKILVTPESEHKHIGLFHHLNNDHGIPAHLVPISWPKGCSPLFLERFLKGDLLTSAAYNARFFSKWVRVPRDCIAGTRDMFQVAHKGSFNRCSQAGIVRPQGSIFAPRWNEGPEPCDQSCYCEWHHWAGATLANDNEVWNYFVETGEWERPTVAGFREFLEKMEWGLGF